jgi:hypothetical protein
MSHFPSVSEIKRGYTTARDRPQKGTRAAIVLDRLEPGRTVTLDRAQLGFRVNDWFVAVTKLRDTYGFDIRVRRVPLTTSYEVLLAGETHKGGYLDFMVDPSLMGRHKRVTIERHKRVPLHTGRKKD